MPSAGPLSIQVRAPSALRASPAQLTCRADNPLAANPVHRVGLARTHHCRPGTPQHAGWLTPAAQPPSRTPPARSCGHTPALRSRRPVEPILAALSTAKGCWTVGRTGGRCARTVRAAPAAARCTEQVRAAAATPCRSCLPIVPPSNRLLLARQACSQGTLVASMHCPDLPRPCGRPWLHSELPRERARDEPIFDALLQSWNRAVSYRVISCVFSECVAC